MSAELQAKVPERARRPKRSGGFSLVELGIVIAAIAVLAAVVVLGAGFFRAARQKTAVDLVLTIRAAASQFAMRHHNGVAYGKSADQSGVLGNVSLKALRAERLLPEKVATPWGNECDTVAACSVGPINLPATPCAGFTCVVIELEVPAEECADGILVNNLALKSKAVGPPTCTGTTLRVVMR